MGTPKTPSVLCVDDDRDIAEVVEAALSDDGYAISCLYTLEDEAVLRAVGRLEPDCVLLDGTSGPEYGDSWVAAAEIASRHRPVPVIMFTAHQAAVDEAEARETDRAVAANFAGILPKPFHLDDLLTAVAAAVGRSAPFDRGATAEAARTRALVKALKSRGAREVVPSKLREWALFRNAAGSLMQLYWWQARGVYQVGRYTDEGTLSMLGQLVDRDAAIELALPD
jgi:DNA-binding response OmpR family regulator